MRPKFERVDEASIRIPRADVSHIRRKWLDIAYANTSQAQKLDLYLPEERDGPFPVIVHIHGGGFAILLQHGRLDRMVPVQQSEILAQKLEEIVGLDRFEFDILEDAGHGDRQFESDENLDRVFRFVDRCLG